MGLNFQTCTLINSNLDPDSKGAELFGAKEDTFVVKRDFRFKKDCVLAIRKAVGYDAVACKATIDFSDEALLAELQPEGVKRTYCRLDIYVALEGAEYYMYSTPEVQKGKPFWIEFVVKSTDSAETIAKNVYDLLIKNHIFLMDKDQVNVTLDGSKLVLEGATEFLRFKSIKVLVFDETQEGADLAAEMGDNAVVLDERGKNSFGTYSQIVKDLRLPTAANYQWTHLRQVETPIVGAIYNQYIIEYCDKAANHGTQFVGERGLSHTTHVFWVKNDDELIAEWEEGLSAICDDIEESKLPE